MSQAEHPWQTVLAHAIVGTDRRSFSRPPVGGDLGDLLARIDASQPDKALLDALALASSHRRAGHLPARVAVRPPEPCGPDDLPRCSPLAAQHLRLMLTSEYAAVLPEWLAALAAARQRIPEEHLPDILDLGRNRVGLRSALLPVIGERGRWLARHNPAWDFTLSIKLESAEQIWDTGDRSARLAALYSLRLRDPARARELLAGSWAHDKAEDRAAFVAALADGLSLSDEDFLEAALDDRSKEVRRAAANVLASLPESRLCFRMRERLRPLITLERGFLGAKALIVNLPETCDPAMTRDGVEPVPPRGQGQQAWWLRQMLTACPPTLWNETLLQAAGELVRLAKLTVWRGLLLEAWSLAAERYRDADWAEAVLGALLEEAEAVSPGALLQVLPPDRRRAMAIIALEANPHLAADHPAQRVLDEYHSQWDVEFSRELLVRLAEYIRKDQGAYPGRMLARLQDIALRMHPSLAAEAADRLARVVTDRPHWSSAVDKSVALLHFRYQMLKELGQ